LIKNTVIKIRIFKENIVNRISHLQLEEWFKVEKYQKKKYKIYLIRIILLNAYVVVVQDKNITVAIIY